MVSTSSAAVWLTVPAKTSSPGSLAAGATFAGDRALVDGALARLHHAVDRDAVAGSHHDDVAHGDFVHLDFFYGVAAAHAAVDGISSPSTLTAFRARSRA